MKRGIEKNYDIENIIIEVNSLKLADDKTFIDCIRGFTGVVLD